MLYLVINSNILNNPMLYIELLELLCIVGWGAFLSTRKWDGASHRSKIITCASLFVAFIAFYAFFIGLSFELPVYGNYIY